MTATERVGRTRRALMAALALRAALWGTAAGLAVAAVATLVTRLDDRTAGDASIWGVAGAVGVTVAALLVAPWRKLSLERVALWIEERVPALRWALVTAIDPRYAGTAVGASLEGVVARISWREPLRRSFWRAGAPALGAAALAAMMLVGARLVPLAAAARGPGAVTATRAPDGSVPRPFERLRATVKVPAYAGGRTTTIESPVRIGALAGSAITLTAPGTAADITAELGGRALAVRDGADGWETSLVLGAAPMVLRLRHSSGDRLVALEPRVDSAPAVRLTLPARDTVVREPRGSLRLAAEATDDIGLTSGGFEYIVSSGEGETFEFRTGTVGVRRLGGAASAALAATITLETLDLEPGDIVHFRAVARDANDVSGPGVGASETRTLRVARAGEYDSVAVEGAPPPEVDKSVLSQRMLIMLTEALDRRRPRLTREALLGEARTISRDQARLRKRVGEIIFMRLGDDPTGEHEHGPGETEAEHAAHAAPAVPGAQPDSARAGGAADSAREALLRAASAATTAGAEILDFEGDETPIVAINRPLLEAYNHMWEATRELDQGETQRALPPMRRALEAIQRARQAERIYLRGKAPTVVVDLARVRLTGKDSGATSPRTPRAPAGAESERRARRLVDAIALAAVEPLAAVDSLVLLRVEALADDPALAAALADAADALREGRDATNALVRARRIADGAVARRGALRGWSGAW